MSEKKQILFHYSFYARVPLITGLIVFILPIYTQLSDAGESLLRSIFSVKDWDLFFATTALIFTAVTLRMTWRSILVNASSRYDIPPLRDTEQYQKLKKKFWLVWIVLLLPTIVVLIINTEQATLTAIGIVAVSSFFSFGLFVTLPLVMSPADGDWYIDKDAVRQRKLVEMYIPESKRINFGFTQKFVDIISPPRFLRPFMQGYVDDHGRFNNSHATLIYILLVLGFYFVVAGIFWFRPGGTLPATLVSLLLLISIFNLLLGGMSFLLDRYRIPLFLAAAIVSFSVYSLFNVDHYFVITPNSQASVSLDDAVNNRIKRIPAGKNGKTMVLVAASGGGIQAAVWTSQVLTGLEKQYPSLSDSITIISSVSGGSVGTLFYLDRFNEKEQERDKIVALSSENSLRDVGWGFLYPDLARLVALPILVPDHIDRGWALEESWRHRLYYPEATFGSWRESIKTGELPVPVFNATLVESGKRFLLTPVNLKTLNKQSSDTFNNLYPKTDINVATAARLSSTFPYVSPASRALLKHNDDDTASEAKQAPWHIVDGGYYDNYGVMTLIESLHNKNIPVDKIDNLILIQIRLESPDKPEPQSGWANVVAAPLTTMWNVRGATQRARNDMEIELHKSLMKAECSNDESCLALSSVSFIYNGEEALSWKLSKTQKNEITNQWRQQTTTNTEAYKVLDQFFERKE